MELNIYQIMENLYSAKDFIDKFDILSPFIYIIIYAILTVMMVSYIPLSLLGGVLFGGLKGGIYASIGGTIGATICFIITRYIARSKIEKWVMKNDRIRKIYNETKSDYLKIIIVTRISPIFPEFILNYFYGLINITFKNYVVSTFIILLIKNVVVAMIGAYAINISISRETVNILILTIIVGTLVMLKKYISKLLVSSEN